VRSGDSKAGTDLRQPNRRVETAAGNHHPYEAFLDNVEFLVSTLADTACHVLDNLPSVAVSEIKSEPSVYESRGFIEL
jgi:hypothetical protein